MTPAWICVELARIADSLASAPAPAHAQCTGYRHELRQPSIMGLLTAECSCAAIELRALLGTLVRTSGFEGGSQPQKREGNPQVQDSASTYDGGDSPSMNPVADTLATEAAP